MNEYVDIAETEFGHWVDSLPYAEQMDYFADCLKRFNEYTLNRDRSNDDRILRALRRGEDERDRAERSHDDDYER